MPACKIQCKDDPEADCATCRHRDKDYPFPGGADGKMVIKGITGGCGKNLSRHERRSYLIDTIYQNAAEGLLLRADGSIHTCSCSVACEKILDAIDIYLDR